MIGRELSMMTFCHKLLEERSSCLFLSEGTGRSKVLCVGVGHILRCLLNILDYVFECASGIQGDTNLVVLGV